jgi:hypothetical protein
MAGHVACIGRGRGVHKVLLGKSEGKKSFGITICKWKDNIKKDLKKCDGDMDWVMWLRIWKRGGLL